MKNISIANITELLVSTEKKIQAFQDHVIRANPTHTPETMCCSFLKHKAL